MRTLHSLILAAVLASGPAFAQGGYLGVSLESGETDALGAVVATVETRSAAAVMGLQVGDRITRVDAVQVADARALAAVIGARMPGEIVEIRLVRGDQVKEILGVLGRRPPTSWNGGGDVPPRPRFDLLPPVAPPPASGTDDWLNLDIREFVPRESQAWDDRESDLPSPRARLRGFDFEDFAPQMEELREQLERLQLRHQDLMKDLKAQMHGLDLELRTPRFDLTLPQNDRDGKMRTSVQLRYPEATPAADRDRLRAEAIEKYGPEVEVEFSGTGTSVRIERSLGTANQATKHREGQRDF